MNRRGRRRVQSGLPPATSESRVRIAWLGDRLRRSTIAMKEAMEIIDAARVHNTQGHPDGQQMAYALGRVAEVLGPAIEAEERDARR